MDYIWVQVQGHYSLVWEQLGLDSIDYLEENHDKKTICDDTWDYRIKDLWLKLLQWNDFDD